MNRHRFALVLPALWSSRWFCRLPARARRDERQMLTKSLPPPHSNQILDVNVRDGLVYLSGSDAGTSIATPPRSTFPGNL